MPTKRTRIYPEKNCPTCGIKFAKQGKYCCRACGNSRVFTATYKAKVSNALKQKMIDDPEYKEKQIAKIIPDIPIPPMTESPIGLNQFISDGDLWTNAD
jgi:tRNA(Ile2) C34 agmatinyltransferase TiaS